MTISARPIAFFASCKVLRALTWVLTAAALAAVAAPDTADAARRARIVRAGAYDGIWNVTFAPQAGNCHATNTVPFTVSGTRVSSAGGGKVTGGISRGGSVSVRISVGASWANGSGRLAGNSGAGRWSGIITGDRCSGIWQAVRS
jgi:ABC-type molybdate transport system substrate-binding protein